MVTFLKIKKWSICLQLAGNDGFYERITKWKTNIDHNHDAYKRESRIWYFKKDFSLELWAYGVFCLQQQSNMMSNKKNPHSTIIYTAYANDTLIVVHTLSRVDRYRIIVPHDFRYVHYFVTKIPSPFHESDILK